MNKSEKVAYDWLGKKYPGETIVFQRSKSPDFILSNGEAYEVKRGYLDKAGKKHIVIIRSAQLTEIVEEYPKAVLVVIVEDKIVQQIPVKDLLEKKVVDDVVIHLYEPEGWLRIRCSEQLRRRFKVLCAEEERSYGDMLVTLIKSYKSGIKWA